MTDLLLLLTSMHGSAIKKTIPNSIYAVISTHKIIHFSLTQRLQSLIPLHCYLWGILFPLIWLVSAENALMNDIFGSFVVIVALLTNCFCQKEWRHFSTCEQWSLSQQPEYRNTSEEWLTEGVFLLLIMNLYFCSFYMLIAVNEPAPLCTE